ncbi:uncharacterized protein sS8_3456 [Methylocaldum marinum]|uniref:Uncharacterized protein n=1 Tax=Methylocaldum marinum TaxID=1432792 RepID=A0A250KUP9_9GAMM|nr:hypothetical protein [Methylocaldum marinum]BBA35393.1 uncharacterized protein sS8_3456 [Methylocaldum marinum]
MESNVVKGAIGFAIVIIVGFVIVGTTRETPQEKMQGAFLQTSNLLSTLALDKCTEAVKTEVGTHPYSPSESDSDHVKYVTLIWNNVGSAKRAECRYLMDQGITFLKVDDRTVIEKDAVAATGSETSPPAQDR